MSRLLLAGKATEAPLSRLPASVWSTGAVATVAVTSGSLVCGCGSGWHPSLHRAEVFSSMFVVKYT